MRIDYRTIDSTAALFAAARTYFKQAPRRCGGQVPGEEDKVYCLYREDGTSGSPHTCVAGAFLPDELWTPDKNYARLRAVLHEIEQDNDPDIATHPFVEWCRRHVNTLVDLQRIHDSDKNWRPEGLGSLGWAQFNLLEATSLRPPETPA